MARLGDLPTLPNLLTLLRPAATLPYLWLCTQRRWEVLGLYSIIVASDLLDGWLARRLGQESAFGRTLDHTSDVVFILTVLGYFVSLHVVPWWLPAAIAWSFGLYSLDSWQRPAVRGQRRLIGSRLGHLGGILNYVTVGIATGTLLLPREHLALTVLVWHAGVALLAAGAGLQRLASIVPRLVKALSGMWHRDYEMQP